MPFNFSINPNTFASEQIATAEQQKQFLFKLSQLLTQMTAALNTLDNLVGVKPVIMNSTSATPTFNCANATFIFLGWQPGANGTITFTNLVQGVPIFIHWSGSTFSIKIVATTPSNASYTVLGNQYGTSSYQPIDFNLGVPTSGFANNPAFLWGATGENPAGNPVLDFMCM
jgi:hypothetical protein